MSLFVSDYIDVTLKTAAHNGRCTLSIVARLQVIQRLATGLGVQFGLQKHKAALVVLKLKVLASCSMQCLKAFL